jgi:hypothetical protein
MPTYSTVERAFQIARAGECKSLDEVRTILTREGHTDAIAQTGFPLVRKQLQDLLAGRSPSAPRPAARRRKRGTPRKQGTLSLSLQRS